MWNQLALLFVLKSQRALLFVLKSQRGKQVHMHAPSTESNVKGWKSCCGYSSLPFVQNRHGNFAAAISQLFSISSFILCHGLC